MAAPDGPPAGQAGTVRGAAGQHGRTRACERAPKKGRIPPSGAAGGTAAPRSHILADQRRRPLCVRLTGGQRHDSTQARVLVKAWTGAPPPCLIADQAYGGDAFRAWMAQRAFGPSFPRVPGVWIPTLRPGGVPNAQRGQTRLRLAQGVATRGRPLRPIRPSLPGFSVPGRDLDLAETKSTRPRLRWAHAGFALPTSHSFYSIADRARTGGWERCAMAQCKG